MPVTSPRYHLPFLVCLVALTLAFGCQRDPLPSKGKPPAPCPEEGPCDFEARSDMEVATARAAAEIIDVSAPVQVAALPPDDPEYITMIGGIRERLLMLEGVREVAINGKQLTLITEGGYPYMWHIGDDMGRPLSKDTIAMLTSPPDDLEARIGRLLAAAREDSETRSLALVTEAKPREENQKKRARMFAPFAWHFADWIDTDAQFGSVRDELVKRRDYQGEGRVEIITRDLPYPREDITIETGLLPFHGWQARDFVWIQTHGHGDWFMLASGIVIGAKQRKERDLSSPPEDRFDEVRAYGIDCEEFRGQFTNEIPPGVHCFSHHANAVEGAIDDSFTIHALAVDAYYLTRAGSSPSGARGIYMFESCATMKNFDTSPDKQSFLGEQSVIIGADGSISASNPFPTVFAEILIDSNTTSTRTYANFTPDWYTTKDFPGVLRHYPSTRGLRVAEAITLLEAGAREDEHLTDGTEIPVELDEEGRPRLLSLDVIVRGVNPGALSKSIHGVPYMFEADLKGTHGLWELEVMETGADGDIISSLTEGEHPLTSLEAVDITPGGADIPGNTRRAPLKLRFNRDIDTDEPIYLKAVVKLPEGGESVHTVRITPKPIEATWRLRASGEHTEEVEEYYLVSEHTEVLSRLSLYLTDSQESFTGMSGPTEVDLSIRGFDGMPGTFSGAGSVAMSVFFRDLNISCNDASASVDLTRFASHKDLAGTFASGDAIVCKQDEAPLSIAITGSFLYKDSEL